MRIALLLLASSLCSTAYAAIFSDVGGAHPNRVAIEYVYNKGIVSGNPDGTFAPDSHINRAAFAKMMVTPFADSITIENCDTQKLPFPEEDVPRDSWFAAYICHAFFQELIAGYDDGTYKPANPVTFVEAAKIIVLAFGKPYEKRDVWYEGFVTLLEESNAIPLDIEKLDQPVTRGQIAEMIYRIHAGIQTKPSKTLQTLTVETFPERSLVGSEFQSGELESAMVQLVEGFGFLVPTMLDQLRSLASGPSRPIGSFREYHRGNMYLYVQNQRFILLIKGDTTPSIADGFWEQMEGSRLRNLIAYSIAPGFEIEDVQSDILPGELASVVKEIYGGSIDLKAGQHVMAQLDVQGHLKEVLAAINLPTEDLYASIGREVPSFSYETGAAAAVEGSKKGGNPADALEPTNYIEITKKGDWVNPLDIESTVLTDATVYLDNGPTFGFWGVGRFDREKIALFYKGPLVKSKDPQDYVEAQVGFGAKTLSLETYMKFMLAYSSRLPGSTYSFMGNVNDAKKAALESTFRALRALPLEVVDIENEHMRNLSFTSGDQFPGLKVFNMGILGPLATAKDGTKGPLVRLYGTSRLFGTPFGYIDMQVDSTGANATGNGTIEIDLGSVDGMDLGSLGGNLTLSIVASPSNQAFTIGGSVRGGPLDGREVSLQLHKDHVTFTSSAHCTFPFDIEAKANLPTDALVFIPTAVVPEPQSLFQCPEELFFVIKNGVVYAFNGTIKLAEFATSFLPENDVTKIGIEGMKIASGIITEAPEEILNLAKAIPGVGELTDLSDKLAKEAAEKAAKEAAAAAKKAAEEAAAAAKRAAEQAAQAAKAAAEAAQNAINDSFNFTTDLVSGAASKVIGGLSDFGNAVGSIGGLFGGGGGGPPGFDWKHHVHWSAIDVSIGHDNDLWYVDPDGQAWYASEAGTHNYRPYKAMGGSFPRDFPGFVRIDADSEDRAVAIAKNGELWYVDRNGLWQRGNGYAIDVGIGGGFIWIVSSEPQWGSYRIYRAPYTSGTANWKWQYMHGAGTRIDVGSDGRAWGINAAYEVWEYDGGWKNRDGKGLDISVSRSNRAWIIGTNYNANAGGGQVFTYERGGYQYILGQRHYIHPHWAATAGWAKNIAAGKFTSVIVSNHLNRVYGGTGRE